MIDAIIDALSRGAQWLANIVVAIINGIIDFVRDIKNWFRKLGLKIGRHIPFLAKTKVPGLAPVLKRAKEIDVGIFDKKETLAAGVYDEYDDTISNLKVMGGDQLDEQTKKVIQDEDIVTFK